LGESAAPRRRRLWLRLIILVLLVAGAGFAGWVYYRNAQRLTPEKLADARARWSKANIQDYDITVRVSGRAAATYFVQVRGGKVTDAWQKPGNHASYVIDEVVDGKKVERRVAALPFRSLADAGVWTVPGLFAEVLERDLKTDAEPRAPSAYTQVQFDPDDGHLVRYVRTMHQTSFAVEVELVRR
jgi:muconolactone delta-isomerase